MNAHVCRDTAKNDRIKLHGISKATPHKDHLLDFVRVLLASF